MNIFNRIVVVVLFFAFIAAAVISIMILVGYKLTIPGSIFSQQVTFLQSLSGLTRVAAIAVAVAFILFIAYLIWLEFTVGRPEKTLLVSSNDQGVILVNKDTVEKFAEKVSRQESTSVKDVRCHVKQKREGILIDCLPTLRLGTNMNSVSPRIQTRVKEAVQNLLGLPVLDVRVRARYEPGGRRPEQQELIAAGRGGDGSTK
jgi:uncharacterized alkaline shock family protein YloU